MESLSSARTWLFRLRWIPGRRVIIVDCDLRSPSLGDYLGVPSEPGLLQYLANGHLSPYCYVRRLQNLYFLTSGGVAPNPVEILSMHKMKQLIEHLKKDFDMIILDAPPYFPIADARIVTGLSDGLIMVVRRGKHRPAVATSLSKPWTATSSWALFLTTSNRCSFTRITSSTITSTAKSAVLPRTT